MENEKYYSVLDIAKSLKFTKNQVFYAIRKLKESGVALESIQNEKKHLYTESSYKLIKDYLEASQQDIKASNEVRTVKAIKEASDDNMIKLLLESKDAQIRLLQDEINVLKSTVETYRKQLEARTVEHQQLLEVFSSSPKMLESDTKPRLIDRLFKKKS